MKNIIKESTFKALIGKNLDEEQFHKALEIFKKYDERLSSYICSEILDAIRENCVQETLNTLEKKLVR